MSENEQQDDSNPPAAPAAVAKSQKDIWDKIEILSRPIIASLTAAVIAIIGFFGQNTITELSSQEQNARLYTELLSRREEAESSLRKDMFKEIMSGFFTKIEAKGNSKEQILEGGEEYKGDDIKDNLSKKILKLEMLALNFGDSLSIGPLFTELSSDIERVLMANRNTIDDWKTVAGPYQKRLRSLAKRLASRQLATISSGRNSSDKNEFKISVKTELVEVPDEDEDSESKVFYWMSEEDQNVVDGDKLKLDGVIRFFEITLSNADLENYTVSVSIKILEIPEDKFNKKDNSTRGPEIVAHEDFNLDFFNFPLIDNTRLSHNHRFALIIEEFDSNTIELKGVLFPGVYASQRDKPFLNEAIDDLKANKDKNEDSAKAQEETVN
ncbi:MAG: hypothetical protein DRQ43_04400 [Gammaproteobacteria bacterium]|nr:MAG: hypothetical protein DRQ43_04400 [Gammaproteobacteria bacterium]